MAITREFKMATILSVVNQEMFSAKPLLDGIIDPAEVGEHLELNDFMLEQGNTGALKDPAASIIAEIKRQHEWLGNIKFPIIPEDVPQVVKARAGKMIVEAVQREYGKTIVITQPGPNDRMFTMALN